MKLFKKYSFRNKLPRSLDLRRSDQSGQAMIEYVLVIIISITLLFVAKGFFTNLNNYISGYVGGYFKCLMTQGELPALGVSDGALSKHVNAGYKCTAKFEKSNIDQNSGAGTKTVGTTTKLSSDKPKGSTKDTASKRGGSDSASSKSKKSNKRRPGRINSGDDDSDATRFSSNTRNRSNAYSSSDSEGDENVRGVPMITRDLSSEKSEPGYRPVSGEMDAALKKRTRGGRVTSKSGTKSVTIASEEEARPGPRRTKFNPPTRAVAAVEEEAPVEMGFGYFMKWIMIAGIGIAIFIFFGGQIMNYNNSDK